MKPIEVKTEVIEHKGHNVTFWLRGEGATLKFRIHYDDNTRKNASYKDYTATDIYFEGIDNRPNTMGSYYLHYVSDLCLFAERYTQWLLEKVVREG